jgi:hypothetical protein
VPDVGLLAQAGSSLVAQAHALVTVAGVNATDLAGPPSQLSVTHGA